MPENFHQFFTFVFFLVKEEQNRKDEELPKLQSVESWLEKHSKKTCLQDHTMAMGVQPLYPIDMPNLPVSLRIFSYNDVANIQLNEWG